jgi:titin
MQGVAKFSPGYGWVGRFLLVTLIGNFATLGWSSTNSVTNTADSGAGSFRQALLTANTNPGVNTIVFQISGTPPFTIAPASALPVITNSVVIDATTQVGFTNKPVIALNGSSTSAGTIGLRFSAGASTLRGMAINHFPAQALELDSDANSIQGNFIGTDVTGTLAQGGGTGSYGILVKSAGNIIGGTNSGDGNVISGGNDTGIYLLNVNNNIVQGNLIGVTAAGTTALSNLNNGIVIYGSSGNLIGGPVPSARNLISGNGASGIYLFGAAATGNTIQGNYIGTGTAGTNAISNLSGDGVSLNGAPGNVISGNVISGNGLAGVSISGAGAAGNMLLGNFIGTDVNGKTNLGNYYAGVTISGTGGNQVGGPKAGNGNLISGNVKQGIALTGGTATNLIQGNLIGLSAAGTNALPNGRDGILISGATDNTIGGASGGARNVISGNASNGIDIFQLADSGNTVLGNYLGTDITGTKAIANKQAGLLVQGSANTLGGTAAGAGNVISGNSQQGILLVGTNVTGNVIQGNLIGLNAAGAGTLANGNAGISIIYAAANLVGGTTSAARNVISANGADGIFLFGYTAVSNQVQGNFIGTDPTGTIGEGNGLEGIYMEQAATNQIGGSTAGAGNLISANHSDGLWLTNASWNVIQGNFIGTRADGSNALGNTTHNVELQANASHNTIGGTAPGAGNRLAFAQSVYCGVRVRTGAANNLISGNAIFSNGALGIDLSPTDGGTSAGVNPIVDCESGVAASAANAGQNFPTLSNVYSGTLTRIRGTMDAKTTKTYTLQFFASPTADSSGYGEGQVFLGQTNWILGSTCSSNFTVYLPVSVSPGWVVTATATDATNNTSEFSAAVSSISVPPVQAARASTNQLSLSWTNNGGSFALQQTYSLTPPINWSAVTNVPVLTNNFMVTAVRTTNSSVFYRLTAP